MKTIKLTEEKLNQLIREAVEQAMEPEINQTSFQIARDMTGLIKTMDAMADKFAGLYEETGDEAYNTASSKIFAASERLENFLRDNGHNKNFFDLNK